MYLLFFFVLVMLPMNNKVILLIKLQADPPEKTIKEGCIVEEEYMKFENMTFIYLDFNICS